MKHLAFSSILSLLCVLYTSVSGSTTTGSLQNGSHRLMESCEAVSSLPIAATSPVTVNNPTDSYLQWLEASLELYPGRTYIPTVTNECVGMAVHWYIDRNASKIQFAVAVQAKGWAALGFSETGGMRGSDIVYFSTSDNKVRDAYVLDTNGMPLVDERQQDWTLKNYNVTSDGYLIFEVERALNTYDAQDWPIKDDSAPFVSAHKVIGAWGNSPGISYHGNNRVHTTLQLFPSVNTTDNTEEYAGQQSAAFFNDMKDRSEGSIDLLLGNYTIPLEGTTYEEVCFSTSNLISLGLPSLSSSSSAVYIVGMEFIVPKASKKYTHHIVGSSYTSSANTNPNGCNPAAQQVSFEWAPGSDYISYPSDSGILMGPKGKNAINLQIHFDNRDLDSTANGTGVGVRMYYTTKPQNFILGTFQVGDPFVGLEGKPVGNGWSEHVFACPSGCSSNVFASAPNGEVTVVQEALHMHGTGKRMVNQVIRNGVVVHEASVDYYDFMQSGAVIVRQEPYKILKGDSFRTTCYYETESSTTFGLGSLDEMCIAFLTYYPAQNSLLATCGVDFPFIPVCSASYTGSVVQSETAIGRVFGLNRSLNETKNETFPTSTSDSSFMGASSFLSLFGMLSIVGFLSSQ